MQVKKGDTESLVDCLFKSTIAKKLVDSVLPFISEHMQEALDSQTSYIEVGSENQKKLKEAVSLHEKLRTIVEDLEMTIGFLRITNVGDNLVLFPFIEEEKEYYNYFIENYIIRLSSIPDSLAMLANHINEYGYFPCYGTTIVKDRRGVVNEMEKEIMQQLLDVSNSTRLRRHIKVHEGYVEHDHFKGVVFYADMFKRIGADFKGKELLVGLDHTKLDSNITSIEEDIKSVIEIVVRYLDILTPQLDKYIDEN